MWLIGSTENEPLLSFNDVCLTCGSQIIMTSTESRPCVSCVGVHVSFIQRSGCSAREQELPSHLLWKCTEVKSSHKEPGLLFFVLGPGHVPLSSFPLNCASVARPWAELQLSMAWGNWLVSGLIRGMSIRLVRSTVLVKKKEAKQQFEHGLIFHHIEASLLAACERSWLAELLYSLCSKIGTASSHTLYTGSHEQLQLMRIFRPGWNMIHKLSYCLF